MHWGAPGPNQQICESTDMGPLYITVPVAVCLDMPQMQEQIAIIFTANHMKDSGRPQKEHAKKAQEAT